MKQHTSTSDVCDGNAAAARLGISAVTFFNRFVKQGKIDRVKGRIPGVDAFRVADIDRLIQERMGEPVPRDPDPPAAAFTARDAALMLNMPVHQAREVLAAWGCRIDMDEVSALIAHRHQLHILGKALVDCATRIRLKEAPVTTTPEKAPATHIEIGGVRLFEVTTVAAQTGTPVDQVQAALQELNIIPAAIGNTLLLTDTQAGAVRKHLAQKKAPKPEPKAEPAGHLVGLLLDEQRKTNTLLEQLITLLSTGITLK